jgi:hypothetical protein
MLNYIWLEGAGAEKVAHIVGGVKHEETEAGTEGDVYGTFCGDEIFSWHYGPPSPMWGNQEKALAEDRKVCLACARALAKSYKSYATDFDVKEMRCPICGTKGECFCLEVGKVDFQDKYVFYCSACGFKKEEIKYGGSTCGDDWATSCPYCAKEYIKHKETPAELR